MFHAVVQRFLQDPEKANGNVGLYEAGLTVVPKLISTPFRSPNSLQKHFMTVAMPRYSNLATAESCAKPRRPSICSGFVAVPRPCGRERQQPIGWVSCSKLFDLNRQQTKTLPDILVEVHRDSVTFPLSCLNHSAAGAGERLFRTLALGDVLGGTP